MRRLEARNSVSYYLNSVSHSVTHLFLQAREEQANRLKEESRARLAVPKALLKVARKTRDITKYEYFAREAKVKSLEAQVEQAELEMAEKAAELAAANKSVRIRRDGFGTSFIAEQEHLPEGSVEYQSDLECSSDIEIPVDSNSDDEAGDDVGEDEGLERMEEDLFLGNDTIDLTQDDDRDQDFARFFDNGELDEYGREREEYDEREVGEYDSEFEHLEERDDDERTFV